MDLQLFDMFKERRSIRRYAEGEVSLDTARKLLEIGTYAPSAHNSQPWRYVIIPKGDVREGMIRAISESFRNDLLSDGKSPSEIESRVNESERRMRSASLILLVCLTMKDMWKYGDSRDTAEYTMTVQSVAASVQNILLAAHAHGLGCCWMCAPLFAKQEIINTLSLPEDYEPQAFVLIGLPDESPMMPRRRPIEEVLVIMEENME